MDQIQDDLGVDYDFDIPQVQQIFVPRYNYWIILNDQQFRQRFRLSKDAARMLLHRISPVITNVTDRFWSVPPMTQLLVVLRFYATSAFMQVIGDFQGLSKSTVWKVIHRVSRAIASLRGEFIRFPSTLEEIRLAQAKFFRKAALPGIVGAIDCKQVRVKSFGGNDAELYRNRKGFFSINVQVVCDADLEIIDIVARWPGSVHDSTIFLNSNIHTNFEAGRYGDALLVGDSGYALSSYLLTPLRNPQTPAENLYNESIIRTRNPIERCFGVWSNRFHILNSSRFRRVDRILVIIVATAVLHNICRRMIPRDDEHEYIDVEQYAQFHDTLGIHPNINLRQQLIDTHFGILQ